MKLCEANNGARNILEFYFADPLSWFKNHPTLQLGILTKAPKVISSSSSSSTKRTTLCFFLWRIFHDSFIFHPSLRRNGKLWTNSIKTNICPHTAHTMLSKMFSRIVLNILWNNNKAPKGTSLNAAVMVSFFQCMFETCRPSFCLIFWFAFYKTISSFDFFYHFPKIWSTTVTCSPIFSFISQPLFKIWI